MKFIQRVFVILAIITGLMAPLYTSSQAHASGCTRVPSTIGMKVWAAHETLHNAGLYVVNRPNSNWRVRMTGPRPHACVARGARVEINAYAPLVLVRATSYDAWPLRSISGLVTERIDEGQDFSGTGPLYAIGTGVITSIWGSGWPSGVYILEHVTGGRAAGRWVYFAENITPSSWPGEQVNTNTIIGWMYNGGSGIEIGWGTSTPQQTLAAATTGYCCGEATAAGYSFSSFLQSIRLAADPQVKG
jgi:hypothetical protein